MKVERSAMLASEETYVVKLVPKSGPVVLLFVSSRTGLTVQRESGRETTTFGDYRNIDGELVPFRTTIRDPLGEATIEFTEVQFNVEIPPATFSGPGR